MIVSVLSEYKIRPQIIFIVCKYMSLFALSEKNKSNYKKLRYSFFGGGDVQLKCNNIGCNRPQATILNPANKKYPNDQYYDTCCPSCTSGTHTQNCNTVTQQPYVIVSGHPKLGDKSVLVTTHNFKFANPRGAHIEILNSDVNDRSALPKLWSVFSVGPATVGGIKNMAIMRQIIGLHTQRQTPAHITVYYGPDASTKYGEYS